MITIILAFTGCFRSYPMGLSEKQWERLSTVEQTKLTTQQYELDKKHAIEREKQRRLRMQFLEKQRIAEENRISELYAKAQYKDIVIVNFYRALYQVSKNWYPMQPDTITLVRGEVKKFKINILRNNRSYRTETIWAKYDIQGTKVTVYLDNPNYRGRSMVILNNGRWYKERRYSKNFLEKYNSIKDMTIGVRYLKVNSDALTIDVYKYK